MAKSNYGIPGSNRVTLGNELVEEIRQRFEDDRENRFQLYLLSSGIRRKYLDKKSGNYTDEFQSWYKKTKMDELYGSLANFTKYAMCGEVVNYVGTKTSNPDKYLKQLPVSVGSLYEISMILRSDEDLFKMCLHYTPRRSSLDEEKYDWKTPRPALINKSITELKVRTWRQKWENPPPPKQKRTDKRTLKFVTIQVNGELFDFDRKTGDKTGCVDLPDVEEFLTKLRSLFDEQTEQRFKLTDELEYLTNGYYKRKDSYDVTRNIKKGKPDRSGRYK